MDKVEYKIRADEIKALIGEGRYADAVKIADTIDWKRVKSIQMLCTISDLYKINRRYEESRDVLLMAYDKHPTGRSIVYSLCELAIKMGEFVQAVEYYKEFVRIAPRDSGRYILQYKLYEAQEVSLEERIAVLEEFKKHDYRERWAYELAYLYHRVGLTTECVEECDEMFLWFGEGKYVMKALELKALHEPLTAEQQDRYNRSKEKSRGTIDTETVFEKDDTYQSDNSATAPIETTKQPTKEMPQITDEVINAYNTGRPVHNTQEIIPDNTQAVQQTTGSFVEDTLVYNPPVHEDEIVYPHINEIKEPSVDVSVYNTTNLQAALAEGLREIIASEQLADTSIEYNPEQASDNTRVYTPQEPAVQVQTAEQPAVSDETRVFTPQNTGNLPKPTGNMEELFFDTQTVEIPSAPTLGIDIKYGGNGPILGVAKDTASEVPAEELSDDVEDLNEESFDNITEDASNEESEELQKDETPVEEPENNIPEERIVRPTTKPTFGAFEYEEKPLEEEVPGAVIHPNASYQMPRVFENILSQESDGQISLAVQPEPEVEKQITGQISIADYLENWEQYKKEQQEKQLQSVKKRVTDETGDMFANFDEKTKAGLQEQIEKAISEAIRKEQYDKASGRSDYSMSREDAINAAVAQVVEKSTAEEEVQGDEFLEDLTPEEENDILKEAGSLEASNGEVEDLRDELEEKENVSDKKASKVEPEPVVADEKPLQEAEQEENEEENQEEEEKLPEDKEPHKETTKPVNKSVSKSENKPETKPEKKAEKHKENKKHIGNREIEERVRTMTPEEKELFGPYIHHKKSRRQIINAIDNMSMDAFSGNAIVTGEEGAGTVNLAKGLIKAVQYSDSNFSGKVAKITANTLNKKSTSGIFEKLANGALIIQRAADLEPETVSELLKILQEENKGLIVVMEDTKEDMDRFLDKNPSLKQSFNVRVDIEALDDDSLVAYAKQYAFEKEYAIDNLGILALHTRISERQTLDHEVTVAEVKDIIDDAIYYAEKRSVGHFIDVIVRKRYDENDMVILREKDFMH